MRVLLATGNPHKVDEIRDILGDAFEVAPHEPGVDETGTTFEDNALLKARAVVVATGELAIADDSGIEVDALGGAPGVHSARWAAEGEWIPRLLRELAATGDHDRTARFVCAAAACWPDGREVVVRGVVDGRVADTARGDAGFGYDPVFVPDEGDGRTFGEMTADEKHALSHRARAFRALAEQLG